MRVALFTHQWPEVRLGGIGTYVRHAATALVAAGHEAHVFTLTLDDNAREHLPPGVIFHEVRTLAERVQMGTLPAASAAAINGGGEAIYRLAIGWLLTGEFISVHHNEPFDIVETPDVEALSLPLLLNPDRPCPVVIHLHCCTAIAHEANEIEIGPPERLIQSLEFSAIHLADGLCAPTQTVVDTTRAFTPIDREPVIIPYPFAGDRQAFTAPPIDGPILFQGRIERLKGCAVIADALNIFLLRNPAARFHFIGPDTSTAANGRSMRRHILDTLSPSVLNQVSMLGEISREQVDTQISACSFFVQPSLRENFSLVCCEAMSAGRAVIVGDGTGSVELVGDAGVVVPRGAAVDLAREMESLYRDRERLNALSRGAHARIRTLCDPASVTTRRVEFYQQTLEQFRRHGGSSRIESLPIKIAAAVLPALARITGTLTGMHCSPAQSPGSRLNYLCGQIGPKATILLYGAGKHTSRLMAERHAWERQGHRVVGIIDDHPRFEQKPLFLDLPVQSLTAAEAVVTNGRTLPPVILSTDTYEDQFWENTTRLRDMGVAVFRLYGHRQSA